jgi:hypothetical protein
MTNKQLRALSVAGIRYVFGRESQPENEWFIPTKWDDEFDCVAAINLKDDEFVLGPWLNLDFEPLEG